MRLAIFTVFSALLICILVLLINNNSTTTLDTISRSGSDQSDNASKTNGQSNADFVFSFKDRLGNETNIYRVIVGNVTLDNFDSKQIKLTKKQLTLGKTLSVNDRPFEYSTDQILKLGNDTIINLYRPLKSHLDIIFEGMPDHINQAEVSYTTKFNQPNQQTSENTICPNNLSDSKPVKLDGGNSVELELYEGLTKVNPTLQTGFLNPDIATIDISTDTVNQLSFHYIESTTLTLNIVNNNDVFNKNLILNNKSEKNFDPIFKNVSDNKVVFNDLRLGVYQLSLDDGYILTSKYKSNNFILDGTKSIITLNDFNQSFDLVAVPITPVKVNIQNTWKSARVRFYMNPLINENLSKYSDDYSSINNFYSTIVEWKKDQEEIFYLISGEYEIELNAYQSDNEVTYGSADVRHMNANFNTVIPHQDEVKIVNLQYPDTGNVIINLDNELLDLNSVAVIPVEKTLQDLASNRADIRMEIIHKDKAIFKTIPVGTYYAKVMETDLEKNFESKPFDIIPNATTSVLIETDFTIYDNAKIKLLNKEMYPIKNTRVSLNYSGMKFKSISDENGIVNFGIIDENIKNPEIRLTPQRGMIKSSTIRRKVLPRLKSTQTVVFEDMSNIYYNVVDDNEDHLTNLYMTFKSDNYIIYDNMEGPKHESFYELEMIPTGLGRVLTRGKITNNEMVLLSEFDTRTSNKFTFVLKDKKTAKVLFYDFDYHILNNITIFPNMKYPELIFNTDLPSQDLRKYKSRHIVENSGQVTFSSEWLAYENGYIYNHKTGLGYIENEKIKLEKDNDYFLRQPASIQVQTNQDERMYLFIRPPKDYHLPILTFQIKNTSMNDFALNLQPQKWHIDLLYSDTKDRLLEAFKQRLDKNLMNVRENGNIMISPIKITTNLNE